MENFRYTDRRMRVVRIFLNELICIRFTAIDVRLKTICKKNNKYCLDEMEYPIIKKFNKNLFIEDNGWVEFLKNNWKRS